MGKEVDYMSIALIHDSDIKKRVWVLHKSGYLFTEIAQLLSKEFNQRILPVMVWRVIHNVTVATHKTVREYEYPSLEEIVYIFNVSMQKEKNSTLIKHVETVIRRNLMLKILNKYHNKEFEYIEVKNECKDREDEENFLRHWEYLVKFNYIEENGNGKFIFCDRVKRWHLYKRI